MGQPTTCLRCGSTELKGGFLHDDGGQRAGHVQWVDGDVELGANGTVRNLQGRTHFDVLAFRCPQCGFVEINAGTRFGH